MRQEDTACKDLSPHWGNVISLHVIAEPVAFPPKPGTVDGEGQSFCVSHATEVVLSKVTFGIDPWSWCEAVMLAAVLLW